MKLLSLFVTSMALSFLISGCTAKKSESALLSDRKACTEEDCPSPQSSISGDLIISPDAGAYQMNVDKSDIIEIAGKCSDLGFRANKILVEVYEGEDTSIPAGPYINNATSFNCINSTTTSPVINGQRCIWITDGKGAVVTDISGNPVLEFPQCYNGKFSFSVRLGKILRDNPTGQSDDSTNPRKKYLVRFKLRVDDPIRESAWNSAVVERGLTKPTGTTTPDLPGYNCNFSVNASKNINLSTDISYSANLVREYPVGGTTTEHIFPYTLTASTPPVGAPISGGLFFLNYLEPAGWGLKDFSLANRNTTPGSPISMIPGVRHKIKLTAYDRKYMPNYSLSALGAPTSMYDGITEESTSDEIECGYQQIFLQGTQEPDPIANCADIANGFCQVYPVLPDLSAVTLGYLEYAVVKNKTSYADNYDPIVGTAIANCFEGSGAGSNPTSGSSIEGCRYTRNLSSPGLKFMARDYAKNNCTNGGSNTYSANYGIAVRFVDNATNKKSAWSNTVSCNLVSN